MKLPRPRSGQQRQAKTAPTRTLVAVGGLSIALLLAGCGASGPGGNASSGAHAPLRIAAIPPLSGALAVYGEASLRADRFAVQQANAHGGVDGHKVVLVTEQTDGTANGTETGARRAVQQGNAHFLTSIMTDPEALAVEPVLSALNAVFVNTLATGDQDNGSSCVSRAFRVVPSNTMEMTSAQSVLKKLPAKTWDILAEDYYPGHHNAALFESLLKRAGEKVGKVLFSPLGTSDFGSSISQLSSSHADGLLVVEYGTDASSFISQAQQYHLLKKYKSVLGVDAVNDPLLPALKKTALGMYETSDYESQVGTPSNKAFVKQWKARFGKAPYYVDADNYLAMQAIFAGVKKAKSVDPSAVAAAMRGGLSFNSIVGHVTFNPQDNQLERPEYVARVVKGNEAAGLGWKVVASAPPSAARAANPECHLSH